MYSILAVGLFLGLLIFSFFFIIAKCNNRYYLAPLMTFLTAITIILYSYFFVRGFEGMGYVFLAMGILVVSILGAIAIPSLTTSARLMRFTRGDKVGLIVLPVIFFTIVLIPVLNGKDYWIIEQGEMTIQNNTENHYRVSTISEGNREIFIRLGETYAGQKIEVEGINQKDGTEVVLHMVKGQGASDKSPFIYIGVDEIEEPLTIRTTAGEEIHSSDEKYNE
ncbi:YesK family protein [Salimicrobium humidisoli]|uniref:YesK-like protein n=1 Tax=Salimicrobium humidisoli TaxID=2029857 RepID=A0ABX4HUX3_9BACI|nr:YesK family protein [Salimicrobium humidisoli]PBB06281.1 hypothetical protein CKW00_04425 [Salimicrobium humidisoli]